MKKIVFINPLFDTIEIYMATMPFALPLEDIELTDSAWTIPDAAQTITNNCIGAYTCAQHQHRHECLAVFIDTIQSLQPDLVADAVHFVELVDFDTWAATLRAV